MDEWSIRHLTASVLHGTECDAACTNYTNAALFVRVWQSAHQPGGLKTVNDCRECEAYASHVVGASLDFNTEEEKEQVQLVFDNAVRCLSEEDRGLQAIQHILPIMRAGIGVHHSGLLPIIKELTELLFQEQLIKVGHAEPPLSCHF